MERGFRFGDCYDKANSIRSEMKLINEKIDKDFEYRDKIDHNEDFDGDMALKNYYDIKNNLNNLLQKKPEYIKECTDVNNPFTLPEVESMRFNLDENKDYRTNSLLSAYRNKRKRSFLSKLFNLKN